MKTVIKGGDAVKTVARRDSATAALKKLGIQAKDYNLFILQTTDGRYAVSLDKAAEYLQAKLRLVATEEIPQAQNLGKTAKEAASNQIKRPSVAGVIRKLILDGLDNKQIHERMKADFGHDDDKAHYPAWYRSRMRRDGLVPKIDKPAKVAKLPKEPTVKRSANKAVKAKKKKAATQPAKKKKSSKLAQTNIDQTAAASFKTGNTLETVAPHMHIQVK